MHSTLFTAALAISLGSAAALAQQGATRNATVPQGKPARVAVVTSLKNDCSQGEGGSIRIVTASKNGSLVVRGSKMKTPASFRCPNVETNVQALFYQSNPTFTGADEIAYETRSADGATQTVTVKITVSGKPADKKGGSGILDL